MGEPTSDRKYVSLSFLSLTGEERTHLKNFVNGMDVSYDWWMTDVDTDPEGTVE